MDGHLPGQRGSNGYAGEEADRACRNVCSVMAAQRRVSADNRRQATDDDGREETANGQWVSHECEIGVICARATT